MLLLTLTVALAPFSPWLAIAVLLYGLMGSARGVSGVRKVVKVFEIVTEGELAGTSPAPAPAAPPASAPKP